MRRSSIVCCAVRREAAMRSGFTLMEMMVVITAMTAISVTGALLVGLLMSAETQGARAVVKQQTLSRLGRQLRNDAHAATAAEIVEGDASHPSALALMQSDGGEVRWSAEDAAIVRDATDPAAGPQRETFRLPDGAVRFRYDEAAGLVELVYESAADPLTDTYSTHAPPGAVRIQRIQAAVGGAASLPASSQ